MNNETSFADNTSIKTIADATLELSRKTTQTFSELSARAFHDMVEYAGTVSKAQASFFSGYAPVNFSEMTENWNKVQSEMIKGYSNWMDSVRNLTK